MDYGNLVVEKAMWMLTNGYLRIDNKGRVWRTAILNRSRWIAITPRRAENKGNKGYLRITLLVDGVTRSVQAHRLVWMWTNKTEIPPQLQINHINLKKSDNRPENLEVCDGAANIQHSYRNGRRLPWSDATEWRGRKRVDERTKRAIKARRASGDILRVIAAEFGLSITHTQRICGKGGTSGKSA